MPSQLHSRIPRVQELLDQGKTHAEIVKETGVSSRTVSRWLSQGLLLRPSPVSVGVAATDAPERAPDQEWTARDLLDMGMDPAAAERLLMVVEDTAATSNLRFREWLSRYIPLAGKIPDEWAAAIAFLPILGRDVCNPALETLGEMMHESVPWEDERLRRRYDRLAKPLLREARVELNDWLIFGSNTETVTESPVGEAAVISEALRRCPHVDRPVRRARTGSQGGQDVRSPPGEGNADGRSRYELGPPSRRRPWMARSIWGLHAGISGGRCGPEECSGRRRNETGSSGNVGLWP